jgi:hypothetical protein
MGTKSREVLYGGQVRAAKMNAESARSELSGLAIGFVASIRV